MAMTALQRISDIYRRLDTKVGGVLPGGAPREVRTLVPVTQAPAQAPPTGPVQSQEPPRQYAKGKEGEIQKFIDTNYQTIYSAVNRLPTGTEQAVDFKGRTVTAKVYEDPKVQDQRLASIKTYLEQQLGPSEGTRIYGEVVANARQQGEMAQYAQQSWEEQAGPTATQKLPSFASQVKSYVGGVAQKIAGVGEEYQEKPTILTPFKTVSYATEPARAIASSIPVFGTYDIGDRVITPETEQYLYGGKATVPQAIKFLTVGPAKSFFESEYIKKSVSGSMDEYTKLVKQAEDIQGRYLGGQIDKTEFDKQMYSIYTNPAFQNIAQFSSLVPLTQSERYKMAPAGVRFGLKGTSALGEVVSYSIPGVREAKALSLTSIGAGQVSEGQYLRGGLTLGMSALPFFKGGGKAAQTGTGTWLGLPRKTYVGTAVFGGLAGGSEYMQTKDIASALGAGLGTGLGILGTSALAVKTTQPVTQQQLRISQQRFAKLESLGKQLGLSKQEVVKLQYAKENKIFDSSYYGLKTKALNKASKGNMFNYSQMQERAKQFNKAFPSIQYTKGAVKMPMVEYQDWAKLMALEAKRGKALTGNEAYAFSSKESKPIIGSGIKIKQGGKTSTFERITIKEQLTPKRNVFLGIKGQEELLKTPVDVKLVTLTKKVRVPYKGYRGIGSAQTSSILTGKPQAKDYFRIRSKGGVTDIAALKRARGFEKELIVKGMPEGTDLLKISKAPGHQIKGVERVLSSGLKQKVLFKDEFTGESAVLRGYTQKRGVSPLSKSLKGKAPEALWNVQKAGKKLGTVRGEEKVSELLMTSQKEILPGSLLERTGQITARMGGGKEQLKTAVEFYVAPRGEPRGTVGFKVHVPKEPVPPREGTIFISSTGESKVLPGKVAPQGKGYLNYFVEGKKVTLGYIESAAKGQGTGTRLVQELEKIYPGKQIEAVSTGDASGFYKKTGWDIARPPLKTNAVEGGQLDFWKTKAPKMVQPKGIALAPKAVPSIAPKVSVVPKPRPIPLSKGSTTLIGLSFSKQTQAQRNLLVPKVSTKSTTQFVFKPKEEYKEETLPVTISRTGTRTIQSVVQVQQPAEITKPALVEKPITTTIPAVTPLVTPRPTGQPYITSRPGQPVTIPPFGGFRGISGRKKKKPVKGIKGFYVVTKKFKKPVVITPKPLIKGEALAFGVKYTKRTERATFQLVPAKAKPVKIGIFPMTESQVFAKGYRPPKKFKPDVFVQKRKTRMSSFRESKAIQAYKGKKGMWAGL